MGFRVDAPTSKQAGWWVWDGAKKIYQIVGHRKTNQRQEDGFSPSSDLAQCDPIIALNVISSLEVRASGGWVARPLKNGVALTDEHFGETIPIAICRCFIAGALGSAVSVPAMLVAR